jgi:predicted nucleic acid-binding protein
VAQALILDCEALAALAFATQRAVAARRARAILQVAYDEHALVRVPSPVLAEVYRGGRRDAAVDRVLNGRGIEVIDLTHAMAKRAGSLLGRARLGSAHAVDAFVVATAIAFASAVIATHDPDDLRRLATAHPSVRIFAI